MKWKRGTSLSPSVSSPSLSPSSKTVPVPVADVYIYFSFCWVFFPGQAWKATGVARVSVRISKCLGGGVVRWSKKRESAPLFSKKKNKKELCGSGRGMSHPFLFQKKIPILESRNSRVKHRASGDAWNRNASNEGGGFLHIAPEGEGGKGKMWVLSYSHLSEHPQRIYHVTPYQKGGGGLGHGARRRGDLPNPSLKFINALINQHPPHAVLPSSPPPQQKRKNGGFHFLDKTWRFRSPLLSEPRTCEIFCFLGRKGGGGW